MAQNSWPDSDIAAGGWNQTAGSFRYDVLDAVSETQWVEGTNTSTTLKMTLEDQVDPYGYRSEVRGRVGYEVSSKIEWRAEYTGFTGTVQVRTLIYQGASLIHTGTTRTLTTSPTTYTENLTTTTEDITDWADLRIWIEAVSIATGRTARVYWCRFITPIRYTILRPYGTISNTGSFTNEAGGSTDIWNGLTAVSGIISYDTNYIRCSAISSTVNCELKLQPTGDPGPLADMETANEMHFTLIRCWRQDSGQSIRADLYQGATLIMTGTTRSPSLSTWTNYSESLTTTEANNITDYSDLRLRIYHTGDASFGVFTRVSVATLYIAERGKITFTS
jgi:hypothetical protein